MSHECLFEIAIDESDWYIDCLWIAGVSIGLTLVQFLTLAPFLKPTIINYVKMVKDALQMQQQQADNSEFDLAAITAQTEISKDEMKQRMATFWKDYARTFSVCGLNFNAYVIVISIACFFVTLGTIFLIYSVDDPRIVWRNEGWKQTINGPTMLIVLIGGSNSIMLSTTKSTIESVLVYYKSTTITDAFHCIYWVSVLTPTVFFCIYYPYMVCSLLVTAFGIAISIGIICTCGACFTLCCLYLALYMILNALFECVLCPLTCCVSKEKHAFCKQLLVFSVAYVMVVYGFTVLMLVVIYAVTGGITASDVCIHDNIKSWLALLYLQLGPIIGGIASGYKFCKCIKSHAGSMELKEEYVNDEESVYRPPVPTEMTSNVNKTSDHDQVY